MAAHHTTLNGPRSRVVGSWCALVLGALAIVTASLDAQRPVRVVTLVPAVTEMLFAMGAGQAVVGVSSFETYPPEARMLPRVGALIDPDFERILSLKPDLAVVYASQTDLIARLERARVPLFRYEHAGLADITSTIRSLGHRLERAAEAEALAGRIEHDLDAIRRSVAGRARPRTALLFGREPGALRNIYASGGVGFMHDMLVAAGGLDVFDDVKRQNLQATAEILLARAPDIIVEVRAAENWTADRIARERAVWNALPSVPAVRNGRIHFVFDVRLAIPGPRVAEAVRVLAETVHGSVGAPLLSLRQLLDIDGLAAHDHRASTR